MNKSAAVFAGVVACVVLLAAFVAASGSARDVPQRLSFSLATGPSGGTYFPVGEAIAAIVSHPQGAGRCEIEGVCGPVGLIASAQTSSGAVANARDVNASRVDSGLSQSNVVAEAVAGRGPFRADGAAIHIRTIAMLFPEDVLVVAARASGIRTLADLRGKRVSLGLPGSGTLVTAREVVDAARLSGHLRISTDSADIAARRIEDGTLDAFFFVGGAPVPFVQSLVSRGKAVLVPIDGAIRKALLRETSGLVAASLPPGEYVGQSRTETVATHAVLITNDKEPSDVVFAITRALFHPSNRQMLAAAHPSAADIRLETATAGSPAPLHPGAARFYASVPSALARSDLPPRR